MSKRVLLAVGLIALVGVASFAQVFDFTLVNKTGKIISEVYVSPSIDEEWGDDVLGVDVLGNNESIDISFDPEFEAALLEYGVDLYDLKCVFADGAEMVWSELKLEEIMEISLSIRGGKGIATFK